MWVFIKNGISDGTELEGVGGIGLGEREEAGLLGEI